MDINNNLNSGEPEASQPVKPVERRSEPSTPRAPSAPTGGPFNNIREPRRGPANTLGEIGRDQPGFFEDAHRRSRKQDPWIYRGYYREQAKQKAAQRRRQMEDYKMKLEIQKLEKENRLLDQRLAPQKTLIQP